MTHSGANDTLCYSLCYNVVLNITTPSLIISENRELDEVYLGGKPSLYLS